jgi:branched-chain amino acid aminotransferase
MNYGDGLFEGIRIHNGEILFFEDHIDRMFRAMRALKMDEPEHFSDSFFHKQIIELAREEKVGANARVRIGIFRSGKGLYEPAQNPPEYFIEILPIESGFKWIEEEVEVEVFTEIPKNFSSISFFKSMNALPSVMASIYRKEKNLADCFLLNSDSKVADAISSNVFWIEKGKIFSPPISDGGVEGVMRKNLIRIFDKKNFPYEEKSITPDDLKTADEIFLTNVSWAIKPVTKFESTSYCSFITKEIFHLFMRELSA